MSTTNFKLFRKAKDFRAVLEGDSILRKKLGFCPTCGHNIKDRKVTLYKELISALYEIYKWCGEKEVHEFETKDIKHLLSKNNYARFGDLVRFGGVVYKPKDEHGKSRKALFGLNMKRAKEFFAGKRDIPIQITLNQITNEIVESHYVTVRDFPKLIELLDEKGLYDYEKDLIPSPRAGKLF